MAERQGSGLSRRGLLGSVAAVAAGSPLVAAAAATQPETTDTAHRILGLFARLPGTVSLKIVAPPAGGKRGMRVVLSPSQRLFVGSAIKTFVLAECLRQADGPGVVQTLRDRQLDLDERVWSADSATFNPPHLKGVVSERTTLEAMIMHSDNTGTDMSLKLAGPDKVRAFIAAAGLGSTQIPDSTRSFFGYLLGARDYKNFTWAQLVAAADDPIVNPPLNDTETLASSADDLVSYYSRALQGAFFRHQETLAEFRRILSLGDAIWLVPLPIGGSAFVKGGSIDVPGFHALCVPGGMLFGDRWVYFAFILNWRASATTDPKTVADFTRAVSRAMEIVKERLSL